MHRVLGRATLVTTGLALCAPGPARAADIDVKVPFPFVVEGERFPAGTYVLERDQADPSVVLINDAKGHSATMFVLTTPAAGQDPAGDRPALTFTRHGDQYQLADIWMSRHQGEQLPTGR